MQAGESAQRLFFALWPDPAVRAALAGVTARLTLPRGRLTPSQNLHVTLVFLGAADAARRACVEAAADAIQAKGFAVTLDRTGWWRRPQVFWAGSSVTPPPLLDLVRALQAGCEDTSTSVRPSACGRSASAWAALESQPPRRISSAA